ncbi:ABC transporter related protein [Glutamicibacter creatinolyticus]|uniref:ABC transporter related protein n=1 Tax=Glutamicibacter creatinolyticus TaxID=162496 RepID=A0A5B7WRM4_9MICC|nr:ABC transporter ATP-binding protein [Glutamicibacter creatinolyticus]QCY45914.1 ABC transporter related protein [Glutamicibacter creatinolyticus]
MGEAIIQISALRKSFGRVEALRGLDLELAPGQIHGFLGPNGSGKTTTIRVLLGLLRADAGRVRLFGADPWRGAVSLHRRLAYVPGEVNLWPKLTGGEVIDLLTALRGAADKARRDEMIERFELDPRRKTRTYSKGNRQKVALVAALSSDVDLLILDEPTSGLDPLMERVFQHAVQEAAERGTAVLLSSHLLAEVEKLCSHVTIIRDGRSVESGTLQQLRHLTRSDVVLSSDIPLERLRGLQGVEAVHQEQGLIRFSIEQQRVAGLLRVLGGYTVHSFSCTPPSLEELFLHHYQAGAGR